MKTGWLKESGKWYYLNAKGAMVTGWKTISGKRYYFRPSGIMKTGWLFLDDSWYYLNAKGAMLTGWQTIGKKQYYLDSVLGVMARGIVYIDGKYYRFADSGAYKGTVTDLTSLYSEYAYAEDVEGHVPLISKNADRKMWPASMTKMMTIILAIENCPDLDRRVTVSNSMIHDLDGLGLTQAGYEPGDRPTIRDLLYAACLPSAADATNILAYAVAGSPAKFITMMNEKAAELGMTRTHFANNHGDDNPQNYSTCRDMAKLIAYGTENPMFRKVISTYSYTTTAVSSHPYGIYLRSIVLIYCEGYGSTYQYKIPGLIGGKSGYTPDAGYTLAVIAEENGKKRVYVTSDSWVRRYYPSHVEDASDMALYLH
jgi:D-alanyl-D-alanine carboxypeptidase (penicillin-binding protein 5/6)